MTWFIESPWPSVMLGLAAEAVLAVLLVRTRRGNIAGAMVAVATATIGLVVMERLIVTESEAVEDSLEELRRALAANDAQAALAMFADDSPRRGAVQSALSHVTVRTAKIGRDLEVHPNKLAVPPSATAEFTGTAEVQDNRAAIPHEHLIRKLKVTLRKEGEHWRVFDYIDADARQAGAPSR